MQVLIDGVAFVPISALSPEQRTLAALDLRFDSDAGDNLSVREYLCALLSLVWKEGEGFDGKRPFGNSGWHYEVYKPLIAAGFIKGKLDENGYVEDVMAGAEKYVDELIRAMCGLEAKTPPHLPGSGNP